MVPRETPVERDIRKAFPPQSVSSKVQRSVPERGKNKIPNPNHHQYTPIYLEFILVPIL